MTHQSPRMYWEARACQFATQGEGLAAVCSYGMPAFYNLYIDFLQSRALHDWLCVDAGTRVLDVGCGVGRWSRRIAHAGAIVTGVDLSPTMIAEARRRSTAEGLSRRCQFLVSDIASLALNCRFDLILGVTVLQHILDDGRVGLALRGLASHLAPHSRMVLIEAAPSRRTNRCDSRVFVARDESAYQQLFRAAGLRCIERRGIDPAPFKTWLLPWYRELPGGIRQAALAAATVGAFPIDAVTARWSANASWHKLFVLVPE
jgi:2-polyprenyl-3-methyl-5-hydroxy-6-metoxy-1,4-benzoquinol methylase